MDKVELIKKFKKYYLNVHGSKCKDLTLEDWSIGQLKHGVKALKFIIDKK